MWHIQKEYLNETYFVTIIWLLFPELSLATTVCFYMTLQLLWKGLKTAEKLYKFINVV